MSNPPEHEVHVSESASPPSGDADPRSSRPETSKAKARNQRTKSAGSRFDNSSAHKTVNMVNQFPQYIGRTGFGFVVMIKDSYGFLKTVDDDLNQQMFFHVSEVMNVPAADAARPDLRKMFKPGDEVEFTFDPSKYNDGRLHAKQVSKLKAGTLKLQEIDTERRKGTAELNNSGAVVVAYTRHDTDGQLVTKQLGFHPKHDVLPGSEAVEAGDVVEFCLAIDKMSMTQKAVNVEVIAKAYSELSLAGQCLGHVIKLAEEGGEIRRIDTGEEIPFNKEDMERAGGLHKLTLKCEVSFTLKEVLGSTVGVEGTPRWRATNVRLLPAGMITSEQSLGQQRGKIAAMPSSDKPNASDGVVEYELNGVIRQCSFGANDVDEIMASLHVGDEVEFELVRNKFVDLCGARNLTLLLHAKQGVEIGQVSVLKKNFGFIKCCSRITDMFFHVNALQPGSEPLAAGADVQFIPVLDTNTNKLIASELIVLPPGSAVFETVSEREYEGIVRVPCQPPAGALPGVAGVLVGFVEGKTEMLPFSDGDVAGEAPAVDQKVLFHIIEDRRISMMTRKASKMTRVTKPGGKRAGSVRICLEPERSAPRPIPKSHAAAARDVEVGSSSPHQGAVVPLEKRAGRLKGKVVRMTKKKIDGKVPCGYIRPLLAAGQLGSWTARKPRRNADQVTGTSPPGNGASEVQPHGLPEDALFLVSELSPEIRDILRVNNEVEYSIAHDENGVVKAIDIVRLTSPKVIKHPIVPSPGLPSILSSSPSADRPFLKFTGGSGAVNAKGPDGTRGFAAGRGRPLLDPQHGRNLSTSFKLSSAIMAANFVPKGTEDESSTSVPPPDSRQFEDGVLSTGQHAVYSSVS